jgi:Tol biopolymer transport system component
MPAEADNQSSWIVKHCETPDPPQLCLRNVNTGEVIQITNRESFSFTAFSLPSWSPDGKQLVYTAAERENQPFQVYTIQADGTGGRQLTGDNFHYYDSIWSPDGDWIATNPNCERLQVIRLDGSAPVDIVPFQENFCIGWPSLSPDGQRIAFIDVFDYLSRPVTIWVVERDGNQRRELFTAPDIFKNLGDGVHQIAWSPDGQKIGFWYTIHGARKGFLIASDGSLDPMPIDWDTPTWWLPSFWPPWGKR